MSKTFNLEEYDTIVINDLSLNGSFLTNFQVGVPIGTILPWQDINTIPDGWKLCDGNGTYTDISGITRQIPDLRSKFIIGHDTRDTSFNIDTIGSSFVYRESDSDPDKPRRAFVLGEVNDEPLNSSDMYENVYYSLAYIIRVSNPNISTDTAGDKVINGNLTMSGKLIANGDLSANGNLYVDGNVGIGTTSPDVPFEVIGNQNITNPNQLDLQNAIAKFTANDVAGVVVGSINGNTPYIADCNGSSQNSTGLRFLTNSTTRMTISTAGNIGIGTTSPTYTMDIRGDLKLSGDIRITQTYAANGVSKRIVFGVNYNNQGFGEYTIAHVTGNSGAEWNNSHLRFSTPGSTNALTIKQNGAVGININATKAMFEIYGTVTYNMWGRWYNKDGNNGWQNANRTLSLYAHSHMACAELHVWSDRRIKKNISEVPDNLSLQIIRDLPVKYYHHIDELTKGPHQVIGFIAQEVKELLPNCVHIGPNVIPDEYRFLEDFTWEETTDNKFKLKCDLQDCSGVSYVFQAANNLEEKAKDITVVGNEDNTFTFDKKYSLLFLYGREVDDFHYIDESQIYAVGISALQEVDKQQQADKAKIATLETQVASLETQLTDVLSRLAALETA